MHRISEGSIDWMASAHTRVASSGSGLFVATVSRQPLSPVKISW